MEIIYFDNKLNNKLKKELNSKSIKLDVVNYIKQNSLNNYPSSFLSKYYTPIYTVIKQLKILIKNKKILEIGANVPFFLNFLESKGAIVKGIDIKPLIEHKNIILKSVEDDLSGIFKNKFDIIYQRLTFSKLYDDNYYRDHKKYRFENKDKLLKNISKILKKNGYLILLDDRGSIFTPELFEKYHFKKVIMECPVFFKNENNHNGWNVIVVYRKE
jgi:SAM-dependent methyltransferase